MMSVIQMLRGDKPVLPTGTLHIISDKFRGTLAIPEKLDPSRHGDAQRIKILKLAEEYGEVNIGFLSGELHISPNAVQNHLDKLVGLKSLVKHEPAKRSPGVRNTWTLTEEA